MHSFPRHQPAIPHRPGAFALARRRVLLGLASLACLPACARAIAAPAGPAQPEPPRELWVSRPESQEEVRVVYWADGALVPEGYQELEHLFRDIIAGQRHSIHIDLLHLNFALQSAVQALLSPRPIILFSGFRTPRTSALVGGTRPDIHTQGWADDFIVPGLSFDDNLRLARYFQVGGLGVYPRRGSLHKDVGRLRSWFDPSPAGVRRMEERE